MENDHDQADVPKPSDSLPKPTQFLASRLTPDQAAELLRIRPKTLWEWRKRSYGPPYRKIGNRIEYLAKEIEDWYANERIEPQGTAKPKRNLVLPAARRRKRNEPLDRTKGKSWHRRSRIEAARRSEAELRVNKE